MTKLRKGLAVLVAFVLVFSAMIQATFAAPENAGFSDVTGHWAEDQILEWSDKGIIVGNNGKFSPDSGITRAEFCSIINRAFGFSEKSGSNFFDIKPEKWYSKDVAIAKEAGYILGYGNNLFGPEDKITRQDAARILQNIFKFEASEGQSKTPFVDDKDIASYAKEAVAVFSSKGYILGDKNHFYPKNSITRAEFVAIMDRAVDQLYVAAGTYKESKVAGNAVVKTGDVILKDMVIEGNLYLAEGIGQGNVTLENVTVKGKTFVNGGGENSIILQNTTLGSLVIEKKDGKIRIVAKDGTVVAYAELHSGARLEEEGTGSGFENVEVQEILPGQQIILDGDFKLVNIEAPGVAMQVTDGTVGTFTIGSHASGSSIQVAQGTVVGTLAANAPVSVSGQGKITHAQINAAGVVLEQRPGRVTLSAGVTASVSGQTVNQSYNKSTGGGSSSSENNTPEKVATPVFSVPAGTYTTVQSIAITCSTAGSSIRYTIDGSTPNADSTLYTSPISIVSNTTLKAIAIKSGKTDSSVASATYIINIIPETVATPVFSVPEGTYTIAQNVEITCSTAGSSIRYTTDGSTPNADSTLYTSPINIETTTTLKAIAIKSGMTDSSVASATYTINPSQEDPWTLVWSDEFDGSSIDTDKWRFENSGGGFGNNEQQYYRTQNAVLEDGKLVIKAKKEDYDIRHYTSAKLYSKAAWKYGRFEACIKLPLGQGFWPAFWMMPNDGAYGDNGVTGAYGGWAASGEIDIMEAKGRIPNVASGALHYGGAWPNNKFTGEEYTFPSGQVIDQFHTYSLEWEPGEIRWYIDGQLYQTQNNWNTKGADGEEKFAFPAPFDKEFYLMLNLAIGGNFDGGLMPDDSMFPAQMEVDYVRVYTLTGRPYMAPVEPSIVIEPLPEDAREPDDTGNLVKDFNFSEGIKDNPEGDDADFGEVWNFVHNAQFGGTATTAVENIDGKNYAKIDVTNRGSQPYSVQLEQLTTLGKGRWYRFSFDAKADKNRALSTKLGGGSDAGWAAYSDAYSPNLTTEIQHFSYEFQMTRDTDIKTRIEFNCATDTGPVWMGNVRVEEINPPSVDYHAAKEPLPSGNHIYNGAFDKYTIDRMAYWNVSMSGASAVVKVPETTRELTAEITEGGTDAGDITVDQKGLQLIKNSEYKLTFKARADAGRTIRVKLASKDGSTVYIPEQEITLTTDMQVFEETFKMAADTDREAQLIFLLGGSNSVVYIDDVSLICTTVDYTGVELYPLNNGDFSLGLTGWTTFTQPGSTAAANFSVENSEAKISVSNVGSGEWHVMLFHPNIAISKGITYEFSFDAKASVDRDIQVTIENDNYQPGFPKTSIQLTSEKKNFSYTFTPTKDESLTLKFLMGSTAKGVPGDIFISNVVLQVKNAPVSRPPSFAPDTSNNRLGQQIELIFGDDTAWRAVNPTVKVEDQVLTADQYAFTSGMITLNSSVFDTAKRYKIVIQATGYADVVVMQDILANDGNAVKNGDMSNGTENWNTWNGDGGIGALEVVDGVAKIDISNIGPQNWSIQLYQDGVLIEAGKTYELSLKAWSTIDRPIQVEFTGYNGNESVKFNLTSDNSAIHKYYLSIPQTNSSFKLNFLIGNVVNGVKTTPSDAHILYIDDVVIKEAVVQNAPSLIADLTENVIGQDIEITFTDDSAWRAAIEAVKVDGVVLASSAYSIIAGKLTIDRSCFVEGRDYTIIVEAEGYYHTQVTQTMQSGKIWVEVGSNLITDGTFDTTTTSFDAIWSIHNQGLYESWAGLGAFEVVDGAVEVTVNQVGWDWWQIQLFQLNVNVPAGVYKIAFDMSSEIERPVYVELTGSSAPRQTFTVGSITQTYEAIINVTAPGSFKFMFGLGRAGTDPELTTPYKITIDNVKLIEVKEAAPALIADDTNNTLGKDINITFADNEEWRNAIIDVKVNDIPLDENAYIITNNSIIINADQFPIVGDYTITVDAASYTHAQVVQTIIAPWIEIGTNLLTDGTFDATTTFDTIWKIHNQGIYESWAGLAAFEVVSGIVETTVNQVGWDWWQIQLYQENVNVPAGTYKIAFDMSSEIERPVYVELTGSSAPRQTFAVGSITQTYEAIINVTAPGSFKFMFGLGRAGTDPELTTPYKITIDNVKLIEVQH